MPDDSDPPRKFYELKPRDFERANPARSGDEHTNPLRPDVQRDLPPKAGAPLKPIDVRELNKIASVPGPVLTKRPHTVAQNDVQAALKENFDRQDQSGVFKLQDRPRRKSRRKRDYLMLMLVCNVALGVNAYYALHVGNVVGFVSSVAGMGMLSACFTWVMWFIMDDY